MDSNGDPTPGALPAIHVGWDGVNQGVQLGFDKTQFRSWDFIICVLEMAKAQAEDRRRIGLAQQAQMQMMQAAQDQELRRRLSGQ